VIEDLASRSGTWMHPKTWASAKVNCENSLPVLVRDGTVIKAYTYSFLFNIVQENFN